MGAEHIGKAAGGTINVCRFVKLSTAADFTLLQAAANNEIIGVATEAAKAVPIPSASAVVAAEVGDPIQIKKPGEVGLIELAGSVTRGGKIESDADGKGVAMAATAGIRYVGGWALESGGAGARIKMLIWPQAVTNP